MGKKKINLTLVITVILIIAALAVVVTSITYAIWTTVSTATAEINVPVDDYNPSLKYIVFRGLDENGDFTDTDNEIEEYAVVGYTGLVAELMIPSTYNSKAVTTICIDSGASNYSKRLAENPIITSMLIPGSVTNITAGSCKNMSLLKSVTIEGDASITIGELAFAGCYNLTTFSCSRTILGESSSYLFGTDVN